MAVHWVSKGEPTAGGVEQAGEPLTAEGCESNMEAILGRWT
jgi:hypothetical protein